jgi:hypothetical protein
MMPKPRIWAPDDGLPVPTGRRMRLAPVALNARGRSHAEVPGG